MPVLRTQTTKTTSLAAGGQLVLSAGFPGAEAVSGWPGGKATCSIRCTWRSRFSAGYSISSFRAAGTVRAGRCLEVGVGSARRCGVRRGRVSRGVDVNEATGTGRDVGARRVTNASPEWAERLRDAQARANARRIASSDAAVTAWVRALMRDRRDRDDAAAPRTAVAPDAVPIAREARHCSLVVASGEHRVAAPPESATVRPPAKQRCDQPGLATTPRPERSARASAGRAFGQRAYDGAFLGPAAAGGGAVEREPSVAAFVVGEAADQSGLDRAAPAGEPLGGAVAGGEALLAAW